MTHTWHAFSARTRQRGPRLITRQLGIVGATIGEASETQLDVLIWDDGAPVPEWEQWTRPPQVLLVCMDEDENIIWGGDVVRRLRADDSDYVTLTLVSTEGYLNRRYLPSALQYNDWAQTALARNLVFQTTVAGATVISTTSDGMESPTLRTRTYLDSDDKPVLGQLQDLMNVEGGPEFTVDLQWNGTSRSSLLRMFRVRDRLGSALPSPARFEYPGAIRSYQVIEDYTADNGATDVLAVSSGEGDHRPQARAVAALSSQQVKYERRFTPSTSITSLGLLQAHANAELARVRDGLAELTMVADLDTAPQLNVDWRLGDDVLVTVTSPAYPAVRRTDGALVAGMEQRMRVVGWQIDLDARTLVPRMRVTV